MITMFTQNKGFTLIELLAVIVILAIIAVIATPIITGIIEDSKKESFKRSVEEVVEVIKFDMAEKLTDSGYTYTLSDGKIANLNEDVKISNSKGMNGSIKYNKDGEVSYAIYNDKWCEQALSKIKIFLRKEKYYDAFSQLLYYFEKPIMVNLYETLINIFFFCFFIGILIIVLVIPCIKKRKEKSKVQKIQDFLKKLKSSSNTVFTGNCVICLEPFDDNKEKTPLNKVSTLPCGHKFHTECLTKWLTKENKCPLCRKKPMNDTNDEKHNGSRVIEIQRVLNPFLRNYQYNEVTLSIIPIVREESSFSFNGGSSSSYSDSNGGWSDSGGASSSW